MLCSPEGDEIQCMVCLDYPATNNEEEYGALVAGIDLAKAVGGHECGCVLRFSSGHKLGEW